MWVEVAKVTSRMEQPHVKSPILKRPVQPTTAHRHIHIWTGSQPKPLVLNKAIPSHALGYCYLIVVFGDAFQSVGVQTTTHLIRVVLVSFVHFYPFSPPGATVPLNIWIRPVRGPYL